PKCYRIPIHGEPEGTVHPPPSPSWTTILLRVPSGVERQASRLYQNSDTTPLFPTASARIFSLERAVISAPTPDAVARSAPRGLPPPTVPRCASRISGRAPPARREGVRSCHAPTSHTPWTTSSGAPAARRPAATRWTPLSPRCGRRLPWGARRGLPHPPPRKR